MLIYQPFKNSSCPLLYFTFSSPLPICPFTPRSGVRNFTCLRCLHCLSPILSSLLLTFSSYLPPPFSLQASYHTLASSFKVRWREGGKKKKKLTRVEEEIVGGRVTAAYREVGGRLFCSLYIHSHTHTHTHMHTHAHTRTHTDQGSVSSFVSLSCFPSFVSSLTYSWGVCTPSHAHTCMHTAAAQGNEML